MTPFRIVRPRLLAYFVLELGLILGVLWGLVALTTTVAPVPPPADPGVWILIIGGMFALVLFGTQWTNLGGESGLRRELLLFSFISLVLGLSCFVSLWILLPDRRAMPALLALEGAIAVPGAVALWRWLSTRFPLLDATRETILILGTGETARQVCRWVIDQHGDEYGVVGFAEERPGREGQVLAMGVRVQTGTEGLAGFCAGRVDRVLVALDEKRGRLPVRELMELRLRGIEVEEATSFFERISGKIAVETMLPSWLIFSEGFKSTPLRAFGKRAVDLTLSVLLLVLTSPMMVLAALLIKLDSKGPVLYRQERLGRDGRTFELLKFRSMSQHAERDSGPMWTVENDPRITRVGRLIRKLRVDELPQLVNVLRGEMSFVGPRPEREHFVRRLEQKIPYYGLRMMVRPGITGWAQVEYRYGANDEDAMEKLKYDLYYIKNGNLLLDLLVVLKTVRVVLFGKGAR